jgi:D-glycero-D-manno-heptose 1,7-bisphosphate phosphatase
MSEKSGRPAVFLDRDGTINVDKDYVHRADQWEWVPGARDAIRSLNEDGFLIVVVSNQSGIARGLYTEADVRKLQAFVSDAMKLAGGRIDAFYYCPHHPDFGSPCDCRKPAPGMLLRAAEELGIDLARSFMVGDKAIDAQAAEAAGARGVLVRTGYGAEQARKVAPGVPVVADVSAAAAWIRREARRP